MIVIADTTPLNHLILIEQIDLLRALYGRVIVPQAVLSELQAQATFSGHHRAFAADWFSRVIGDHSALLGPLRQSHEPTTASLDIAPHRQRGGVRK
jgi:hypothetical protein